MISTLIQPTARQITSVAEAQVVAELEMGQRRSFTTNEVARVIGAPIGSQRARDVVAALRRHGWLGDPWLELRSALERDPHARAHIGLGSAAFARRLADRRPLPDTIVWSAERPAPKGLRSVYRVIRCTGKRLFGSPLVNGTPVATAERIALEVAMWWRDAGDLRNPEHWVRAVLAQVDIAGLTLGARALGPTVTARLGYIAHAFGADDVANALAELPQAGPIWIGPRSNTRTNYNSTWGVYDNIGVAGTV